MTKLTELVRLVLTTSLSDRQIGTSLNVAKNTVRRYRRIAADRHFTWNELATLDDGAIDARFNSKTKGLSHKVLPDFGQIHEELQKTGVTRQLLWEEYRGATPDNALSYSQFTHYYRQYLRGIKLSMRQIHLPGLHAFVDFSGKRPEIADGSTGEVKRVELFIGALGYSHLIYALALPSQSLPDWINAHVRMLEFFGGTPQIIVPDNLRAAVTKSGKHPIINRSYLELARHYDVTILPARPYKPKDKAKAEVAVQIAQRWILARLRNQTFFSLHELNLEIARLTKELNERPFKRLPGCRQSRFQEIEKAALRPLPADRFEYAEWSGHHTVGSDYHIPIAEHWYSVPYTLVGQTVEARISAATIEIFCNGKRIASHPHCQVRGGHTTLAEHQPPNHRAYAARTPEYFIDWAAKIGPNLLAVVQCQFQRPLPMLGLNACDVLKRLVQQYGAEAAEGAAKRALAIKSPTAKSMRSLLKTGCYVNFMEEVTDQIGLPQHPNVRGPAYYAQGSSPVEEVHHVD